MLRSLSRFHTYIWFSWNLYYQMFWMTGEKILDPSFPFIASDLVPKLGQLVCGELVASTQVFLGRFPHCSHNTISSGWQARLRLQRTNEPWRNYLLSLLVQNDLLRLCKWLQVEWFQGWGEHGPFSLKGLHQSTSRVVSLREFVICPPMLPWLLHERSVEFLFRPLP